MIVGRRQEEERSERGNCAAGVIIFPPVLQGNIRCVTRLVLFFARQRAYIRCLMDTGV